MTDSAATPTPATTYALATIVHLGSGRVDLDHHRIDACAGRPADQWRRLLDRWQEQAAPDWNGRATCAIQVQVQTVQPDGSVRTRPVAHCDTCDQYKVPGVRHQHDVRRAPVVGAMLRCDVGLKRWTDRDGDDWQDRMHSASHDDPRWLVVPRAYTVRVVSIDTEPAWSGLGESYPARTSVEYVVKRSGDWSGYQDDGDGYRYIAAGPGWSYDLDDWRALASELDVVAS